MKKIFISIILVIIIVFSLYNSSNNIVFLNKNELSNYLINNSDGYYNSFSQKDMKVRNINSIDDYNVKIKNSVSEFNFQDKEKIINSIYNFSNKLKNTNYPWFNGKKAFSGPWIFGCIKGNLYEGGLPHTRGNVIILQNNINYMSDIELKKLILHERIHVYQKLYPTDIEKYIQHYQFHKINKRIENTNSRANPDLNEWIYGDNENNKMIALYKNNPNSINDVIIYPNNNSISEHPYEKMAYEISNSIIDNKSI